VRSRARRSWVVSEAWRVGRERVEGGGGVGGGGGGAPYYDGTFYQFGAAAIHNETDQGLRSLAWVPTTNTLWIANEDQSHVFVLDGLGAVTTWIKIKDPIGLFFFHHHLEGGDGGSVNGVDGARSSVGGGGGLGDVVFVGSKSKKQSAVVAYSASNYTLLRSFSLMNMRHPTGIAAHEDVLYVGDQNTNAIHSYKISTGRFIKTIWTKPAGTGFIEQVMLSPC